MDILSPPEQRSPSTLIIHQIKTTKEWAQVIDLDYLCFGEEDPIHWNEADWWVAKIGEKVVGFAGASRISSTTISLCKCGVHPDYRGNNLQRRFIRVREREALRWCYSLLTTYTSIYNTASIHNLARCGFTPSSTTPEWIRWSKKL